MTCIAYRMCQSATMEVITESQPRIKFQLQRVGRCALDANTPGLQSLINLMERMERLGAAPVLNDNLVGGNCGLLVDLPHQDSPALFVSRSGKPPGLHLTAGDFVEVTSFDESSWKACYRSSDPGLRPTSDTPLLHACLAGGSRSRHLWSSQPRVAIHGHSLAEGPGLEAARQLGLPISEHETLFSTPPDLQELEVLLSQHPYPQERCFIRRGHGFFILAADCAEAERTFDEVVLPFLQKQLQQHEKQQQRQQEQGQEQGQGQERRQH